MPPLFPGNHLFPHIQFKKTWIARTSPAITEEEEP